MMLITAPKIATVKDRSTGQSRYASDLVVPGTVVVGLARSPHAHALVKKINSDKAFGIPGVLGVLTADDFTGVALGHHIADEPILTNHVRYVGEGVAAVAAADEAALIAGIAALEIDYDVLPHALNVDDALDLDVPLHDDCPDNIARRFASSPGDWEEASSRVVYWAEGTFDTSPVPHAYLEPRSCLVRVDGDDLELVTGTHAPSVLASHYAKIVQDWGATVVVTTPDIGGSFGAKWEHPTHIICLAFAHKLQSDVSMVMSRRDDMIAGRTRLGMRVKMRIGATAEGTLVAKETQVWADNGAYSLHGPPVMMATTVRGDSLYNYSAVRAEGQLVYTNTMPSECFRGFGIPQSTFAQEQLIDELAHKLGIDPVEMRRRNFIGSGDTSIHGWQVGSCGLDECLETVNERMQAFRECKLQQSDERYKIGYGLSASIHCVSNSGYDETLDLSNVIISVDPDGIICLASGEVELGCGTAEVLYRTVERELDISRDRLRVVLGHTASGPFGRGSFASRTSYFVAHAAIIACEKFTENCMKLVAELGLSTNASVADIALLAVGKGRVSDLNTSGQYLPTGVDAADDAGYGNISTAYTFAVHGACVKVDTLTGKTTVEQYWAAHDAGTIVNPQGAIGQVIGGVVQGIGMALTESVSINAEGQLLNPGYLDDRVATFPDAPQVDVFFPATYEKSGPKGAKTVGEQPIIPVAGCVANAIFDATRKRQYALPMTPEQVWNSLNGVDET